ncbi:MAG: HEAT repeat domain-containing protein, partial [Candidatus Cloacimonadota bacterium]
GIGEGRGEGEGEGRGEGRGEGEGEGWGGKVKQAIGKIAERLFNMYGKTDFETYTETVSRLILVLTPEMQSELLFSKPEIPFWEDVVNKVVDNITADELGNLVAKETKKYSETMVITGEEGEPGEDRLSNINSFLSNIVDRSKRKTELVPAIRESFRREGVKETMLEYMSGGRTKKELLEIIETDLMRTGIDAKALLGIKTLIQKNADIEELLKSLIDLLNHKNPDMRRSVVKSFVDLTDKLLLLGRIDLLKLIIVAFSDRLGREAEKGIFEDIIDGLLILALKLIKEGKHLFAETIDDILNNYLKTLEDPERLKPVVSALSNIGDKGDQKALKHLIYAINRDVAYQIINTELAKKGGEIFSLLLHSMKHINDKITRIRVLSLLIDAAKNVPNSDSFIKTYIEDPKWYVRRNIAIILGEIGGEKSFNLISMMVNDQEPRVRVELMESLGKIKTSESEKLLIEGLKDQDKEVVVRILTSLRKVGTKKAIFPLNDLLEKQSFLKKEKTQEIQERVIAVLCSIGGQEVANILRKVIFNKSIFGRYRYNDKIRLLCVDGLGKMDTIISKQILRRAAWLKNQEVGKRAAEIIKRASLV